MPHELTLEDIIGTWELLEYVLVSDEGASVNPFGSDPIGYLTYTDEGRMWVAFGRRDRSMFASNDLFGGSTTEKALAMDEFATYCGLYEIGRNYVVHYPLMSLYPNRIGSRQVRYVELDGDHLALITPVLPLGGQDQRARLRFRKVEPSDPLTGRRAPGES